MHRRFETGVSAFGARRGAIGVTRNVRKPAVPLDAWQARPVREDPAGAVEPPPPDAPALSAARPHLGDWAVVASVARGIFCRPSCPELSDHGGDRLSYPSGAAAGAAGFRACRRCGPEIWPTSPRFATSADLVGRALHLIAGGVVEREGAVGLARRLDCRIDELEGQLEAELGAGVAALARARRADTARLLLEERALGVADVATAVGFRSSRDLCDTLVALFGLLPGETRGPSVPPADAGSGDRGGWTSLHVRLAFRAPLEPSSLFGHLAATAVPGVEEVREGAYRRALRLANGAGVVALAPRPEHVACSLLLQDRRDVGAALARCRWLLDLDADPDEIGEHLAGDPALAPGVRSHPGRRVPRSVDGAEMALRAVLGQQVSTRAAATQAARLAERHGAALDDPAGGLRRLFPSPEELCGIDPETLAMPRSRRRTLLTLVAALADGALELELGPGADRARAREDLGRIGGVGPWTLELVAMRALGDPDAFPGSDLGVVRGAAALGLPVGGRALLARSERWRPWRSYAVQYLWGALDHPVNEWPPGGGAERIPGARPSPPRTGSARGGRRLPTRGSQPAQRRQR